MRDSFRYTDQPDRDSGRGGKSFCARAAAEKKGAWSRPLRPAFLVFFVCVLLASCAPSVPPRDDVLPQEETAAETVPSPYDEQPAWASAFTPKQKTAGSEEPASEWADAVSTMYVDSYPENFGSVTALTVSAGESGGIPYNIRSRYRKADNTLYLFLPSSADLSAVAVRALHRSGTETGIYRLNFTETEYGVYYGEKSDYVRVVALQSKLPALFLEIDETEGKLSAMHRDSTHRTECYGDMTLTVSESLAAERKWPRETVSRENDPSVPGTVRMRGRGNWTWNQEKKPYQITCEKPVDLLGMGKAKKWVLLANVMDASLLRNQLFYELAANMGMPFSVRIEPVDLFLNGEYMGSYSLCEKVEVGENRVDIDEEKDFLFELDHYYQNERYTFTTRHGKNFTLHSPESDAAVGELREIVNGIEKRIYDGSAEVPRGIDEASFLRYWWIQDLSRNNDTFIGSNFFYYVVGEEKLYAGPIWDMDNTFGIWGGGENLMTGGWHSSNRGWLKHLEEHADFKADLIEYYRNEGRALFAALPGRTDELASYIRESAEMNYLINSRNDYVNSRTASWDEDIAYLRNFIEKRLAWYASKLGE